MVWEKLEAIVGQLRRSSAALDRITALRDQPWVVATETTRHMMLIFQGGGKLLVTVNGDVHYGRYEVIEGAGSVLLDLDGKPRLYKHGFIDDALMVLKLQGHGFEPLVLVNEAKVPDLDVEGYLERVYLGPGRERAEKELQNRSELLGHVRNLELRTWKTERTGVYSKITLGEDPAPDDLYITKNGYQGFLVINGKIVQTFVGVKKHFYGSGDLWIYRPDTYKEPRKTFLYLNGAPAPDGTYKTGWFSSAVVKDGVVV